MNFATLQDDTGNPLVVLEWQTYNNSNDGWESLKARWRVKNLTDSILYDVGIADKTYICASGYRETASGESVDRRIEPGKTEGTQSDSILYGAEDYRRCGGRITRAELKVPAITFKVSKDGKKQGWGAFGRVTTE